MNKSILAGAVFVIAAAVAVPLSAWSAEENAPATPAPSQAAPPPAPAEMPARPGPARPGWGGRQGPMMGGGADWGMRRMWDRRMMWRQSPQEMCERHLARRAAHIAYVTSLLDLTPSQRPLYDKVRSAMDAAAVKQHELCASLPTAEQRGEETVLDRLQRRKQFLEAHLQALQQIQPALQQLYQSLTPAQKAVINHPFRRG